MRIIAIMLCFFTVANVFAQATEANLKTFRNLLWSYEHDQVYCQHEFTPAGLKLIKHYFKQPISICNSTEKQTPELHAAYQRYLKLAQEDKDDGQTAYLVGMANIYGIGIPSSIEGNNHNDLKWLKISADYDYPPAIVAYVDTYIANKNDSEAKEDELRSLSKLRLAAYHKAALKGLKNAYVVMILEAMHQQDKTKVLYWLDKAKQHNADSLPPILALKAALLFGGEFIPQNISEALKVSSAIIVNKESGIHTTAGALRILGHFYATDKQHLDPNRAVDYYRKAALLNDGFAQNQLANLYYTGTWVKQDYTQANYWYCQAAAHAQRPTHPCKEENLNSATAEAEQALTK